MPSLAFLEEMLRMYRIDYKIVGGVSFFQRKEVKDVRAYLRLLVNPVADTCFERVVNVPARGIGKTTVERLRNFARNEQISMMEAARCCSRGDVPSLKSAARKKISSFVDLMDGLIELHATQPSIAELIIQVVERSGYREKLEAEDNQEADERLGNLSELVTMASDFDEETDGRGTLTEFEERNSLDSANDKEDGRGESVTLMTVHAAKGLEFPVVFVGGMEDGLFPSIREGTLAEERQQVEEERRLCYVAFTRAMDRLVLTHARVRRQWGRARYSDHSRFINSIPKDCLAVREEVVAREYSNAYEPNRLRRSRQQQQGSAQAGEGRQTDEFDFDQRVSYDADEVAQVATQSAEPHHSDVIDFEPSSGVGQRIDAGARVSHAKFGQGKVLETRGAGKDLKLLVHFHTVGLKTVLAGYISLSE